MNRLLWKLDCYSYDEFYEKCETRIGGDYKFEKWQVHDTEPKNL